MVTRITLDWDFKNKLKILYYIIKITFYGYECLIIEKSQRKGYHVQLWLKNNLSLSNKNKLRLKWGEDKKHLAMDKLHNNGKQTLFDVKKSINQKGVK